MIAYFLPFFFLILTIATVSMATAALFVRRSARQSAAEVYAVRQSEAASSLKGLSEGQFENAYLRAHGARAQIFLAVAMGGALIASPIALTLLRLIWRFFWARNGYPEFYAEGVLMWQFYMFFGLAAVWVMIAGYVARRYHAGAGQSLETEIIREASAVKQSA